MISFIILNYNSSLLTVKCIDSIVKQMPADSYEIVVVDNGSRPEEYDLLAPFCQEKHCCLVRQAVNTGFGTGNMIGASVAQGDHLCFLNSDVVLVEDCVTPLCQYIDAHPNVGCMTPVQQKVDGRRSRSFPLPTSLPSARQHPEGERPARERDADQRLVHALPRP